MLTSLSVVQESGACILHHLPKPHVSDFRGTQGMCNSEMELVMRSSLSLKLKAFFNIFLIVPLLCKTEWVFCCYCCFDMKCGFFSACKAWYAHS